MESFNMQLWPFFEWLLRTTLQASLLIFLILLVQLMLRGKLGVRWYYYLWLLLLIRLAMPWAPESRFSISNLFQMLFKREPAELVAANSAIAAGNSVAGHETHGIIFVNMLPIIWLGAALVLLFYMFASNISFWGKISRERPLADQKILELVHKCKLQMGIRMALRIVVTDRVKSPALFGFLRPALLLPVGMIETLSLDDLRYVFLHELAHLRRRDILVAHIVSLLQILHWFNPLIWLAFYQMRADRELACDALVLSTMDADEPKKYGRTIINLVELFCQNRHLPAMVGIIEDKLQLKRRIKMIATFKKIPKKWSLLMVVVIVLIAVVALTNATSSSTDDADIREHAPMGWGGYAEGYEASKPPQGYGGYACSPGGDNALGYISYSQSGNRPTTRVKIKRPEDNKANTPMSTGMGYGGYGIGKGGTRVKDTKESDSPDNNTLEPTL